MGEVYSNILVEDTGYWKILVISVFACTFPFWCQLEVAGDKITLPFLVGGGHLSQEKFYV